MSETTGAVVPSLSAGHMPARLAEAPRGVGGNRRKAQDTRRQVQNSLWQQLQMRMTALATARRRLAHSLAATHRAQQALTAGQCFERLLTEVASTLVSLPAEAVAAHLTPTLERISVFLGAEYGTLFECVDDQPGVRATHSWVAPGYPPPPWGVAAPSAGWLAQRLFPGARVVVRHLDALPPEASEERALLRTLGVTALVVIPLAVGGAVVGAVMFAAVHATRVWPTDLLPRLQLLGDLYGMTLARVRAEASALHHLRQLALPLRIRSLGALSASLAHELRQPLMVVLSNAQAAQRVLRAAAPDLDEVREALTEIVADAQRANALIQSVHALLQPGPCAHARFHVHEVIQEVVALLRHDAAAQQIEVRLALDPALPEMCGDRVQIQQVVFNLLLNRYDAVCAAPPGPRQIWVRTGRGAPDAITIAVCDTGVGLDAATMQHMWEPFFTTKPDGLGLGLALCRAIVAAHGGRVWATRNMDRGATVHVTLPVS